MSAATAFARVLRPASRAASFRTASSLAPVSLLRRGLLAGGVAVVAASSRSMASAASIPAPADVAAPPPTASRTPSGTGAPGPTDKVTVDYTGWTTDGKMFDSSVTRGQNITFGLNQVIAGWTEGLQLMTPGETRRLWIPESLAYKGQPGRPAGMLVFDVSLYSVQAAPKPPAVPSDVATPPADAIKTASGLAYKVIKAAPAGSKKPTASNTVTVHYSGWTPDGVMFDSSVARGEPTSFPLNRVIKGWTEGLQLQEQGSTVRFWIPAELAYGANPPRGAPGGQLCFDVELLVIR